MISWAIRHIQNLRLISNGIPKEVVLRRLTKRSRARPDCSQWMGKWSQVWKSIVSKDHEHFTRQGWSYPTLFNPSALPIIVAIDPTTWPTVIA